MSDGTTVEEWPQLGRDGAAASRSSTAASLSSAGASARRAQGKQVLRSAGHRECLHVRIPQETVGRVLGSDWSNLRCIEDKLDLKIAVDQSKRADGYSVFRIPEGPNAQEAQRLLLQKVQIKKEILVHGVVIDALRWKCRSQLEEIRSSWDIRIDLCGAQGIVKISGPPAKLQTSESAIHEMIANVHDMFGIVPTMGDSRAALAGELNASGGPTDDAQQTSRTSAGSGKFGAIKTDDPTRRPDTAQNSCFYMLRSGSINNIRFSISGWRHGIWASTSFGNDRLAKAYKQKEHVFLFWLSGGYFHGVGRMDGLPDERSGSTTLWPDDFPNRASLNFRVTWLKECLVSADCLGLNKESITGTSDATELPPKEAQELRKILMKSADVEHAHWLAASSPAHERISLSETRGRWASLAQAMLDKRCGQLGSSWWMLWCLLSSAFRDCDRHALWSVLQELGARRRFKQAQQLAVALHEFHKARLRSLDTWNAWTSACLRVRTAVEREPSAAQAHLPRLLEDRRCALQACLRGVVQSVAHTERLLMSLQDLCSNGGHLACQQVEEMLESQLDLDKEREEAMLNHSGALDEADNFVEKWQHNMSDLRSARKALRLAEIDLDFAEADERDALRDRVLEEQRQVQSKDVCQMQLLSVGLRLQRILPEVRCTVQRHASDALRGPTDLASVELIGPLLAHGRRRRDYSSREHRILSNQRNLLEKVFFDGKLCVLKRFDCGDEKDLKHFFRESAALQQLRHPNIVDLQAVFFDDDPTGKCAGAAYLQMPHYDMNLEDYVKAGKAATVTAMLFYGTASALEHVHAKGMVHGDVKPSNFVMEGTTPRLCDFELARPETSHQLTRTFIGGTEDYLAPELCVKIEGRYVRDASQAPTSASDVFALGCTWNFINKACQQRHCADLAKRMSSQAASMRPSMRTAIQQMPGVRSSDEVGPEHWADRMLLSPQPKRLLTELPLPYLRKSLGNSCWACAVSSMIPDVSKVQALQLENPSLWRAYQRCRASMRDDHERFNVACSPEEHFSASCGPVAVQKGLNERWLWHGCDAAAAEQILQHGFDTRLARVSGMYGAGTYFTNQLCKALQYSRAIGCSALSKNCAMRYCQCAPEVRYLLLCRVTLGVSFEPLSQLKGQRRPPRHRDGDAFFDSVVAVPRQARGGQQKHYEAVIFKGAQAYPEFLMRFDSS
eukprot:TRINITY_DN67626_c0_g1_i1.p1 TRINITY_DN67626_c0_g1~~TRINITY_DN67626_c0_g1_i1.p1  ORF type:complete len:1187 (-),score=127.22 TRINITY_DN67626_c0_g1_i1:64-3624(-)